jgi:hypothetical protein
MSAPNATDDITPVDLESALPPSPEKLDDSDGSDENVPRQAEHTIEELLLRAREINASGKFIFSCFSELNIFLLLRSQDEILRLQNKLYDSVRSKGTWSDADTDELQKKLKHYRKSLFAVALKSKTRR